MNISIAKRQRGQGMTEYIIIVALIAIAAIAVYQLFGQTVRHQTAAIAQELAGNDGTAARGRASNTATAADNDASTRATNLSNYTGNVGIAGGGGQ